jgi:hypothetical protein
MKFGHIVDPMLLLRQQQHANRIAPTRPLLPWLHLLLSGPNTTASCCAQVWWGQLCLITV